MINIPNTSQDMPTLADIVRPVPAASPILLVREVVAQFRRDPSLLGLPVVENGSFIGLIRKNSFFRTLSRPFALELYSRRQLRELLEKQPICMAPEMDIHQALANLLTIDPALETDCFAVVSANRCLGVVAVSDLMMRISREQTRLLNALEELSCRIRDEVAKAARIQQALLPPRSFLFPGIELAAELVTSTEIGGDFYDYFVVDDRRLGLIIADVSGHGVQAGMVTTAAKASLHALVRQGITTPSALLKALNSAIMATVRQNLLMTCLVAVIDKAEQCILFANAGHNFPYLHRAATNSLEMLQEAVGFPLGFDAEGAYPEHVVPFAPGDTFVLYSDGINECVNGTEDFGLARFEACLTTATHKSAQELVDEVLAALRQHKADERFDDDVTLVIARFEG
jgi:phosphoserine phosphatase RsbU/P